MSADKDLPEGEAEEWGLVVPFVVCQSRGGPYQDEAFVAGFQAGRLDHQLAIAAAAGAQRLLATVYTALVPQVELHAINRGFPYVRAARGSSDTHPAMPEWSYVIFSTVAFE